MSDENKGSVLVTGGAGYIGSHVALALLARGERVVVLDDLSESDESRILPGIEFVRGHTGDSALVEKVINEQGVGSVLHFAGFIRVDESVREPDKYFKNNTENTGILAAACVKAGVKHFIFSSSAAVYGNPERVPAHEDDRLLPINPYGESKLRAEKILLELEGMQKGILRYFNVAGVDPEVRTGYRIEKSPTHMIRSCIRAHLENRKFTIFGSDYPTKDGTCVRDYIHVTDLAAAHVKVLDYLRGSGVTRIFNCGNGIGSSNLEVVQAVGRVAGKELDYSFGPRREGDPAELVADSSRIKSELGWQPKLGLEDMIQHELQWVKRQEEKK
jgi:UDP-glucose 4-epimerase